jgi:DNA-binding transcriptional LysR family regulator
MQGPPDWVTIRIFLAAIELGSITRAGERCGIATAAAAKRMQMLEADSGLPLLERGARGVRPTAAGEAFARHARALLDLAARLAADLHGFAAGSLGSVRLCVTASALAGPELAEALAAFAAERPEVEVDLREDTSLPILQDLMEGRADLGIINSEGRMPPGLEQHPWREDRLLAVFGTRHPLAAKSSTSFYEVLNYPLIGAQEGSSISLLLEEAAQCLGRQLRYRFRMTNTDAARRLVAAGHGLTIMPDSVARPYEQALGLRGIPLTDRWSRRRLQVVARTAEVLPPPARLLLDHLLRSAPGAAEPD